MENELVGRGAMPGFVLEFSRWYREMERGLPETQEYLDQKCGHVVENMREKFLYYMVMALLVEDLFSQFEESFEGEALVDEYIAVGKFKEVLDDYVKDNKDPVLCALAQISSDVYRLSDTTKWDVIIFGAFIFAYGRFEIVKNWLKQTLRSKYCSQGDEAFWKDNRKQIIATGVKQTAPMIYAYARNIHEPNINEFHFHFTWLDQRVGVSLGADNLPKITMLRPPDVQDGALGCPAIFLGVIKRTLQFYLQHLN